MKKLISLLDFVLEQSKIGMEVQSISHQLQNIADRFDKIIRYAKFLKKKLELWMFVPCKLVDGVWFFLEEPVNYSAFEVGMSQKDFNYCFPDCQEYQEAKDRILFEGFLYEISDYDIATLNYLGMRKNRWKIRSESVLLMETNFDKTVEDLAKYNVELTPTAQKQLS